VFEPDSRYAAIGNAILVTPEGREITYKKRRFLPRGASLPLLTEVTVTDGDRLDLIAARTLGQANQGWRIADANDALHPRELLQPARVLRVPVPQSGFQV
jgi:nucleoid-associated protein YgaU